MEGENSGNDEPFNLDILGYTSLPIPRKFSGWVVFRVTKSRRIARDFADAIVLGIGSWWF